jgi:hypothetical protein
MESPIRPLGRLGGGGNFFLGHGLNTYCRQPCVAWHTRGQPVRDFSRSNPLEEAPESLLFFQRMCTLAIRATLLRNTGALLKLLRPLSVYIE